MRHGCLRSPQGKVALLFFPHADHTTDKLTELLDEATTLADRRSDDRHVSVTTYDTRQPAATTAAAVFAALSTLVRAVVPTKFNADTHARSPQTTYYETLREVYVGGDEQIAALETEIATAATPSLVDTSGWSDGWERSMFALCFRWMSDARYIPVQPPIKHEAPNLMIFMAIRLTV